jgi:Zn-dependent protease/CBS domain-containing protein
MRGGFTIGRIFGIQIVVDASWILIFMLVTWQLSVLFGQWHPEWNPWLARGTAAAAALLFFGSVLLHELSHALVAKAHGVQVRTITLFLLGGVANIEREPPSPRAEFLTAIVGPVASVAIGVSFLLLAAVLTRAPLELASGDPVAALAHLGPLTTLLMWLGPVNIIVALFNLLPAFPLDGGRVLRSALWAATKDMRVATLWASRLGQVIAAGFIVAGLAMVFGVSVPVFGSGLIGGLWLAIIGWFLNNAAAQSYQRLLVEELLGGVLVARLMRTHGPVVTPETTVEELVQSWIFGSDERALPVMVGERLVGLVCIHDVRKVQREHFGTTTVGAIMTPRDRLHTAKPGEDVVTAMQTMARADVSQLPVLDGDRMVGLLRRRDIARYLEIHAQPGPSGPNGRTRALRI